MRLTAITVPTIYGVPITVKMIRPRGVRNVRTFQPLVQPFRLVIHSTGNTGMSADAMNHARYLQSVEDADRSFKSWHFTVDDKIIVQHLPLTERTFNAGDGGGPGNSSGISIEICENGNTQLAIENAIKLIVWLQISLSIPSDLVLPHYSFNKKYCPRVILRGVTDTAIMSSWQDFITRVNDFRRTVEPVNQNNCLGHIRDDVLRVGDRVRISPSATHWSTGQLIPSSVRGRVHNVVQVAEGRVLLNGVMSWISNSDLLWVSGG